MGGVNRGCPQCGARVELPPERIVDRCAFCETPLVAAAGEDEPVDLVAPFVVPRERAARILADRVARAWLAPEALRRPPRPDALHGVLVPFYVYDGVARSRFHARVGVGPEGGARKREAMRWYALEGTHATASARTLASGSKGLPEAEADALEPFDLGQALPYRPELCAGWIAERPDVSHATAAAVAAREIAARENAAIREGFLPGDDHEEVGNDTEVELSDVQLVLLPVWIAPLRHHGRLVRLLVNGQTGEPVGELPRSKVKMGAIAAAVLLALASVAGCAGLGALAVWGVR